MDQDIVDELREEPRPEPQLFIDEQTKFHFLNATKWAKFLAIVGIISAILMALAAFSIGSIMSLIPTTGMGSANANMFLGTGGVFITIIYLIIAVIYFIPCLYLLRYANRTKKAIHQSDQVKLAEGIHSQSRFFKFVGILVLIYLILIVLAIIAVIVGGLIGGAFQ